jgi:hypothetical protein
MVQHLPGKFKVLISSFSTVSRPPKKEGNVVIDHRVYEDNIDFIAIMITDFEYEKNF